MTQKNFFKFYFFIKFTLEDNFDSMIEIVTQ